MAKIIRYCKANEEHSGDNVFDVCRPSVLGNPYTHIKDRETKALIKVKTREDAINLYKKYFNSMMTSTDKEAKVFQQAFYKIVEAYKKYDIVYVGCFCKKNESCHADFIVDEVIKSVVKENIKNMLQNNK